DSIVRVKIWDDSQPYYKNNANLASSESPEKLQYTVELQWLEHLWNHEIMFETRVVRANEC
ncbi:MAG: hypothetical protein AB2705_21650, partial [Candidatus Thiodiazotropha sp.]